MNKKYINQIIRKLKCSKKRREEIKRQLLSEMEESSQDAMQNLGNPAEIAAEFNESFSEEEKKAYKKEKWIKIAVLILLIIIVAAGIIWWMLPKQSWLKDSKIFEEDKVADQAELVVEYFDEDDYEALKAISDDNMKTFFDTQDLKSDKALIAENWGEQESIGNVYMLEMTQRGRKSAVVQMHVQYENASVMYTIFFNRDMELEGLWMQ